MWMLCAVGRCQDISLFFVAFSPTCRFIYTSSLSATTDRYAARAISIIISILIFSAREARGEGEKAFVAALSRDPPFKRPPRDVREAGWQPTRSI